MKIYPEELWLTTYRVIIIAIEVAIINSFKLFNPPFTVILKEEYMEHVIDEVTGLYEDQMKASKDFKHWLLNTEESFCGLWASAGFGKSYCARNLVVDVILKHSNYMPVLTSMTHSAVEVLEDFIIYYKL